MSDALPYLAGYPAATLDQVRRLIADNRLQAYLAKKYPDRHAVQSDSALLDYIGELKREHLRSAAPLHRVRYENGMDAIKNALGLHMRSSRVQGAKLKSKQDQARAVIQIGIIIGGADGNFDEHERGVVRDMCFAVGISPAEFDL